ncbi:MAG: hypothetical protein HYZ96_00650 [Candidatus Omnitrophica bacterium]|nr:hypothetical protein [Candidatus Omnitrophota bacterium]
MLRASDVRRVVVALLVGLVGGLSLGGVRLAAEEPAAASPEDLEEPWMEPLPTPFDPELEGLIKEVQEALNAVHQQMVRRKELVKQTVDPAAKSTLYDELERLRKERAELQALLNQLVEEAAVSQRTAIDEALARARWLEQRQERWEKKEELIRDRQE